jgi:hypothetical protein
MDTESKASEPPKIIKDVIQAEQEASKQLDAQIKTIDDNKTSEQDRTAKMKDLGDALMSNAIRQVDELNEMMQKNQNNRGANRLVNEKKHAMTIDFRKMVQATKKGIIVNHQPKNQAFINKLADQALEDGELFNVFIILDEYILGGKEITISRSEEQPTDFEAKVAQLCVNDAYTGNKLINAVTEMAVDLGYQSNEVRNRLSGLFESIDVGQEENFSQMKGIVDEYFPEFPKEQKKFLYSLYDPEAYLNLLTREKNEMLKATDKNGHLKIDNLKKEITEAYHKKYGKNISEGELNNNVERMIGIELSEKMSDSLVDVLTQLYRQLTIDRGQKQFQETENEDFMHGITTTRSTILKALRRLLNHFEEMENENSKDPRYTEMYKMGEMDYVTREVNYKKEGKENIRPITRTIALPFHQKVYLSNFIENQISEFGHWRQKTGYLHDIGLAYNQPAHEGSFFKGIGEFSEQITGVNLDDILSLPDGGLMVEAFHLYTKILQEDSAKRDHRMFASTFTNEFNGNNSKIEAQVIDYLRLKYGKEVSNARLKSAINGAVGLAQGVYMTLPEAQAFIDPISGIGNGGWESFGTNDAGSSLMLSGGLHLMLRWRGERNLYSCLFLENDGVEMTGKDFLKSLIGQGHNHRKAWENAKLRMDSFYDLKSGVEGSSKQNLVFDKMMNLCKTAGIYQRKGWRSLHQFEGHFTYDENQNLNLLESFKSMDAIGYDGYNWFLKTIDASANGVDLSGNTYLEKIIVTDEMLGKLKTDAEKKTLKDKNDLKSVEQREELFKYIHEKYFKPFSNQSYEDYIKLLKVEAQTEVKKGVKENHILPFDNYEMAVQRKISDLFIKRAVTREVAARFPTKFLRIDKDRLNSTGKSRWRQTYEAMITQDKYKNMNRDEFSIVMRDLEFAESLLRSDTSDKIHEAIHILPLDKDHPERSVGEHADLLYNLNEESIKELLKTTSISDERIENVLSLYKVIKDKFIGDIKFLDGEAVEAIDKFPFTFGVENTDMKLCAYRATGPRMIARQIKDMASMEKVVNGFIGLPQLFTQIAKNGDYSQLLKYLTECQDIFRDVHGVGDDFEFNYMIAGMLVNYMRKDQSADSYGGIGGVGSINSIAAEIAGNSNLVREWDVRDIQQFYLALQQARLLPKNNYENNLKPEFEKVWMLDRKTGLPKETGQTKQKEAYKYSIDRALKRFGGEWKNTMSKLMTEILLLASGWLLYQYIKKALEEMRGGKNS